MDLFTRINERMAAKQQMPERDQCLPGRAQPLQTADTHAVLGTGLKPPFAENAESIILGLGCFWGAERVFWELPGVLVTAVGYSGGYTPNPTYEEVCTGKTGHNEVVLVVFDPGQVTLEQVLQRFWQAHDPTQGMRQGNDVGTQYRSGIYTSSPEQTRAAEASRARYAVLLKDAGFGEVTTEIRLAGPFYYAEVYHQQYLAKNPNGYCGLGGTGVRF